MAHIARASIDEKNTGQPQSHVLTGNGKNRVGKTRTEYASSRPDTKMKVKQQKIGASIILTIIISTVFIMTTIVVNSLLEKKKDLEHEERLENMEKLHRRKELEHEKQLRHEQELQHKKELELEELKRKNELMRKKELIKERIKALKQKVKPEEELKKPDEELKTPEEELKLPEEELKLPEKELKLPEEELKLPEEELKLPEEELKKPEEELKQDLTLKETSEIFEKILALTKKIDIKLRLLKNIQKYGRSLLKEDDLKKLRELQFFKVTITRNMAKNVGDFSNQNVKEIFLPKDKLNFVCVPANYVHVSLLMKQQKIEEMKRKRKGSSTTQRTGPEMLLSQEEKKSLFRSMSTENEKQIQNEYELERQKRNQQENENRNKNPFTSRIEVLSKLIDEAEKHFALVKKMSDAPLYSDKHDLLKFVFYVKSLDVFSSVLLSQELVYNCNMESSYGKTAFANFFIGTQREAYSLMLDYLMNLFPRDYDIPQEIRHDLHNIGILTILNNYNFKIQENRFEQRYNHYSASRKLMKEYESNKALEKQQNNFEKERQRRKQKYGSKLRPISYEMLLNAPDDFDAEDVMAFIEDKITKQNSVQEMAADYPRSTEPTTFEHKVEDEFSAIPEVIPVHVVEMVMKLPGLKHSWFGNNSNSLFLDDTNMSPNNTSLPLFSKQLLWHIATSWNLFRRDHSLAYVDTNVLRYEVLKNDAFDYLN